MTFKKDLLDVSANCSVRLRNELLSALATAEAMTDTGNREVL